MKQFLIALAMVITSFSSYSNQTPYELINGVGEQLFTDIKKVNKDGNASSDVMKKIVQEQLIEHVDVKYVSLKLLGKHVKGVKRNDAKAFIGAVEQYLVSTYANALLQYKGQPILFEEQPIAKKSRFASVKAIIKEQNGPDIDMHFKFRQSKDGSWKVYDLVAEGISLLSAKQKEISGRISEVGLAAVTSELKGKA